jgi:hypothetical protein
MRALNRFWKNSSKDDGIIFPAVAFALVLFIYTMFAGGTTYGKSPNEQSRIELAVSLAKFGSVSIDPVLSVYGIPFDRSVRNEKNYSDKAPGLSLLSVPIVWLADSFLPREGNSDLPSYWAVRHLLSWLLIILPAALFPFIALLNFASARRPTYQIALLFALVTPILTYTSVFFGHVPAGVLAAIGWMLILESKTRNPSPGSVAIAGLILATATTIEYPSAITALVIFATMAMRKMPVKVLVIFAGSCLIGFLPCLVYHQYAFGSPFTTGYAFKSDWWHGSLHQAGLFGVTIPRLESLFGILAGTRRGILFYCPLLLLIPFGLIRMEQDKKSSSFPYVALGVLYIWFAAGFSDWQAGWSAAARHLVPCLFIFLFPFARALEYFATVGKKYSLLPWTMLVVTGFSITGSFLSVSLSPFFPEHFSSPLGQLVLPAMADGFFAPTPLFGAHLSLRAYGIFLLLIFEFSAVSIALLGLIKTIRVKVIVPVGLISSAFLYATLIWVLSEPLGEEELNVRRDVLRHIGYSEASQMPGGRAE